MANDFVLFGIHHIVTLLVSAAAACCIYRWGHAAQQRGYTAVSAIALAFLLVALEAWKTWQGFNLYQQPWQALLPLHLCRISSYVCALMLLLRNYRLFEVAFFWGIGGSIAAMATPDLNFDFPHPNFVGFFLGHALVLSSVLFAVSAYQFRPRLRSIGFTAFITALYTGAVALVNLALDTNYLFICHKPQAITLYQYLGPWPWYIGSVWLIGVVVSFILYLPFARQPSRAAR